MDLFRDFENKQNMQDIFLGQLCHARWNGGVIFAAKYDDKFIENKAIYSKNLAGKINVFTGSAPKEIKNHASYADMYVSANTFRDNKRRTDNLYNIGNIVIDIDWHKGLDRYEDVKNVLNEAFDKDMLPIPTMITYTGRGLCIIYSLKRSIPAFKTSNVTKSNKNSSNKAINYYKMVYERLFNTFDKILDPLNIRVDRNVSDVTRLIRLPGSINQEKYKESEDIFASICEIKYSSHKYYDLKELNEYGSDKEISFSNQGANFYHRRLNVLNKIVAIRDGNVTGYRNSLILAYASACAKLDVDVLEETLEFNKTFEDPLRENEVKSCVQSVMRKDGYKISNKWLIEHLDLDIDEIKQLKLGLGERVLLRNENRNKKEERDKLILNYVKEGYLYEDIAIKVNCSVRTVKNVLSKNNVTRYNNRHICDDINSFRKRMIAAFLNNDNNVAFSNEQKCKKRHYKVVIKRAFDDTGIRKRILRDIILKNRPLNRNLKMMHVRDPVLIIS